MKNLINCYIVQLLHCLIVIRKSNNETVKQSSNKSLGFTLVELVMYMGIFSILLIVLTSAFISSLDSHSESQTISAVEQDSRFFLYRFTHDIENAQSVITPAAVGNSSTTLQLVINGITNTYSLSGGILTLANNLGTNNLNNFDTAISNLQFLRLGNSGGKNTITVSLTIASNTKRVSGAETKSFETTIGLR